MIIKVCKHKEEAELGPKCLLGVAGLLVEFRIELVLLLHQVLEAAAGFPVLFLLGGWLHRCFGLLGIARGLVLVFRSVFLAVLVEGVVVLLVLAGVVVFLWPL